MKIKLKPLAEQVVLITGASSGIGLATANMAAERGARVFMVARNEAALARAVAALGARGHTATYAVADVGDAAQLRAAADACVARFGRIDSWVNDAGVTIYAKLVDTPLHEHEQMFRTNYFGVVNGCTAALAHMKANGAIVTVASIASDLPTPILGAYAASKHAVKAYVEGLRMELHADGVPLAVTIIKPAGIDTPIGQHAANHVDGEAIVPPPSYEPDLVANAILHACEHVRRDITVGGVGRLQVLVGTHFPWLLDLLAPVLLKAPFDPSRPKTPGDSLFASNEAGRIHSGDGTQRKTSSYTAAVLHPGVTLGVGAAAAAGVAALLLARSRRR